MDKIHTNATAETRARVERVFLEPLENLGLKRPVKMKAAEYDQMKTNLRGRLAYLDEKDLGALFWAIAGRASGPLKNQWPSEVTVLNFARGIKQPPASVSEMVRSYMRSSAGQAARERGEHLALLCYLRKYGVPQGYFSWGKIRENADEMARRRSRIDDAAGRREYVSREDAGFLQWLIAETELADALVDDRRGAAA